MQFEKDIKFFFFFFFFCLMAKQLCDCACAYTRVGIMIQVYYTLHLLAFQIIYTIFNSSTLFSQQYLAMICIDELQTSTMPRHIG